MCVNCTDASEDLQALRLVNVVDHLCDSGIIFPSSIKQRNVMRAEQIEKIMQAIKSADPESICEDALDDLVYDAAGRGATDSANQADGSDAENHIEDGEDLASRINNEGFERQVEFLLENGVNTTEILKELGLKLAD